MNLTREEAIAILTAIPSSFGNAVGFTKLGDLHNEWIIDMVYGKEDETLQAHRNSYKTTCVSVSLAIIALMYPNEKTLFMRKTDNDVKEIIAQTAKIIKNEVTQALSYAIWGAPMILVKQSATELQTNLCDDARGTSQLVGLGTGSSMTGKHFERIFTDDIVNIEDRTSKAERERTKTVYQELQNLVNEGGRIYNTGTPWHKEDCFTIMPKPKKYDCYSTGIMSEERILDKKQSMLPSLFAANYELRHIASEDIIFVNPVTGGDATLVEQAKYCHIDAAYGGEDSTAFTICRKFSGKYYVYGRMWRKHVDDCEDEIIALRKKFNAGKIVCENNGDKGYLAKELRKKNERVMEYHEDMNKFLKITSYLKSEWRDVVFVQGTDKDYIEQITDYNENAEHDDAPDSLASIIRLLWNKPSEDNVYKPVIY